MGSFGALRTNAVYSRIVPDSWISNIVLGAAGSALMALSAQFSHQFSWSTVPAGWSGVERLRGRV